MALTNISLAPFVANAAPRSSFAVAAVEALRTLVMWEVRLRTRRALARLDARGCADVGLTPEAAAFEAAKPFWRG